MKELKIKFRWETEFKETEIGEIPREWKMKSLGEILAKIIKGKNPKKCLGDLPYLTAKYLRGEEEAEEFYNETAGVLVDENETVIIWDGSNSGEVFKSKKGILASTMCKLLFDEKVANKIYAFYVLKTNEEDIKSAKSGTDDRHVDKEYFLNLLIPLPPLPEQSRIATVLSWFDDLIEVKKRQNEILEKTAMAIFKSWFIDFEPFRDGEFVYSEELEKEIPKGWEVKKLGEVVRIFKGISYKSDEKYQEYIEGSYVFITLDNFMRGGGFKTEYSWIKSERIKPSHLVKESDLIIALTDMTQDAQVVGAPAIITLPKDFEVGVISLDCMKVDPITEHLKYYLYIYLKNTQEENSTFANGVNVLHLIINNFLSGKLILIPPSHILQSFHSLVEPLFQKIILNQKQIMTLRRIRDTLLPLLIFGKLRVEEV
uniref:Restriction endonuclease subunit S n=1 Tax=Thermocrinis ruber TaxID=75906 RepID=A0A7C5X338_9AQUI